MFDKLWNYFSRGKIREADITSSEARACQTSPHSRGSGKIARSSGRSRMYERGNVFFTLFGAVAVVGVLGAGIMSTMRGPLTTMVEVNRIEETKAEMAVGLRLILLNPHPAVSPHLTADADALTEPAEPDACGSAPTGAGCIPGGSSARKTDAWGTPYAYCAWNNGTENAAIGRILGGAVSTNNIAVAMISAGPDRQFQTTCSNAVGGFLNPDDGGGDDIVRKYNYNDAVAGTDGLWELKEGGATDDYARIEEEISVGGGSGAVSTFEGGAAFGSNVRTEGQIETDMISPFPGTTPLDFIEFTGSVLLPEKTGLSCGAPNTGAISYDETEKIVVFCSEAGTWEPLGKKFWIEDDDGIRNNDALAPHVGIGTSSSSSFGLDVGGGLRADALTTVGAATIGTTLAVTNDSDLNGKLDVAGDTLLGAKLDVVGDTELDGKLGVDDTSEFRADVTVISDVFINKTATGGGRLTAEDSITATEGDITATAGDVVATAGDVIATAGNVVATAGNVEATAGDVTAGQDVIAERHVKATTGDIESIAGNLIALGTSGKVVGKSFHRGSDGALDFSDIEACDPETEKTVWSSISGWGCEPDNGTGTGTDGEMTLEDVLGRGNDAEGQNAEDFGKLGADEYCDAGLAECITAEELIEGSQIWKRNTGDATKVYYNGGNVGIGTDNPSNMLDVLGNVGIGGGMAVTGGAAFDTNTLIVDAVNNRVGVLNATPMTAFDVAGTMKMGTGGEDCTTSDANDMTGSVRYVAGDNKFEVCADENEGWEDLFSSGDKGGLWQPDDGGKPFIEYEDALGGIRVASIAGAQPVQGWTLDTANSLIFVNTKVGATQYCDPTGANCFQPGDVAGSGGAGGFWRNDGPGEADGEIYYTGGWVGIGTNDPKNPLHLHTEGAAYSMALSTGTDSDSPSIVFYSLFDNPSETLGTNNPSGGNKGWRVGPLGNSSASTALQNDFYIASWDGSDWLSRITFEMGGNVGFGTTTPVTKLDVAGTLKIGDGTELCNSIDHEGAMKYDAATDEFYVCRNSTTGWEIIGSGTGSGGGSGGSGGEIIAFSAKNGSRNTSTNVIQNYADTLENEGSAFNATTGVFTAPSDGVYFFSANARINADDTNVNIYKNGTLVNSSHQDTGLDNQMVTSVVSLASGDEVTMVMNVSPFNGNSTNFQGFKLGGGGSGGGSGQLCIPNTSDDSLPLFASGTSGGITVTTSSDYSGSYPGWKTLDNNTGTEWVAANNVTSGWLRVQYPSATKVLGYGMTGRGAGSGDNPKNWTFEGSDNGSTWTVLDTQTNITNLTNVPKAFVLASEANYTYYRVNISATVSSADDLGMMEFEIYSDENCYDFTGGDTLAGLSCSNGQVAAWNSSSSEWECADGGTGGGSGSDTEGISVYGSTTSITSAGATIAFGTVRENDFGAGAWDGSAFTVPVGKGGWYALSAGLSMGAAGAGKTGLYIRVNGATLMGQRDIDASASFTTVQNVSTLHKLADGDVVTVMGQTDSGTFTAANNVLTYFSATKIGGGGGGTDTLAGLSCTDGQVAAWNAAGSEWECADGGTGGGDGSPFVFCTNENSNGDTTDDLDACVGATNVTSVEYRALSCQYTGITDRAYSGDYIRWNGTKWVFRAYNGTEYDCVDGTVMVADATATGGTGSGTDTLSELNCTNSQVAAWNSASGSWQCANINGFGGFEGGEGGGDDANVVKNDNLPEAITCANGTDSRVFYFFRKQPSAGWVEYRERSNGYLIQFNMADKTFVSTNYSGSNCANKSIATLTSEGKTFKFTEGATGTIIAGFPDVIECDYGTSNERYYYIAWSNATKTRYRDSGNYYYDFDNTTKAWVADNLNTSCRNQSIANIQASNFDYELVGGDQSKTFLEGIPDAIFCKDTAGDSYMYSVSLDYDDGDIRYYTLNGSYYVEFYESTGAYKGNNRVTDCNNKSLSDLQDAGVTANFVDKNGTDVPEVVEDDYAYNGWPDLIVCTGAGTNHVLRLGSYNSTNFEYEDMSSGISYMRFNRDTKAWVAEDPDITTTDCTGKSLAELETAGLTRALKGGGAETSMVPGYPDVLACLASAGSDMYYFHYGSNDGTYIRYHWTGSTSHYIRFNSADGTWQADSVNTVCRNKTLTQLQSEGLSYNLLGGTDSGSMETGWPDVMKCEYGGFPELYFIGDLDLDASPYVTYRSSRGRYVRWNRDGGTFNASSGGSTCHNKSYDQVMLEGRGMNLVNTDNASSQSNGMYNQASMIENFPDALACRELNSLTNDVYVYWIRYNNNNLVRYESYYTSASIMLNFSENGIFSSSDATILTDCEGKSIDELIAYGQAFYLNGGGGGGSFASDTLADLSCNTGQVAAWDGDSWECADGGIGGGGSGSGQDVSFRVDKNGTNQTVTANTNVVLTWSREIFDTNDDFDLGTGRFTPTVAGKYLLTLNGNCSDNTSSCNVQIRKNGTPIANAHVNTATAGQNHSISTIVDMNGTTDYVDATVYNGGGTTVNGNVSLANFTGALIGGGGSGGGGDTLAGLSCTDGQVASWSSGVDQWVCADGGTGGGGGGGQDVSFSVKSSSSQSIPNATSTKANFSVENFDSNNNFDIATGRFTPTVAGKYILSAYGQFGSLDANAWAIVQIFKNGANVQGGNFQRISSASGIGSTASVIIDANGTTDYFEVYVYHGGSSGAKNIDLVQFSGALVGGGGSDTLSGLSCTDGQVAAWNDVAGQWACTDMASGGSGGSGQDVSFHVHKNGTAQTVSASTFTKLTWGTETFDTNDNFASDRFTPTVAGKYLITLSTACGTSSTNCQPHIYKNGAAYARSVQTGSASTITNSVTAIVDMNGTTDYVEGYIFTAQTSVLGTVTDTFFSGALFGGGGSGGGSAAQDVSFSASTGTVTTGADPRAANFTTEEFDTTNAFDLTTDQFTPQTPGKYIITLWAQGQTIPDGEALVCYIYKNGASVANQINRQSSANNNLTCSVSQVVDMNGSTDYVAGFVYDSNGAVAAARITGALIGGGGGGGGSDTLAGLSCTSGQVAAWDGSAWACEDMGAGGGSGGSTMVEDWPDAIQCTAGAVTMILYAGNMPDSDGRFYYGEPWSTGSSYYIGFNADGTYASQVTRDYTDCKTSITAIKADGRAFNFVGGGGGSGSGFTCPAGFTKIESQGQTLGCMQTNENGSGVSWETATNTCYTAHGGRLPSSSEWYIAMNNYTLTAENDDSEWNNDQTGDNEHSISGTAATNSSFNGDSNTGNAYRCFIPAGANGGGSGSGDSVWTDSGNGYLEYAGTDMGVKLQNITGMDQPAIGLTSGMTWDEATSTLSVDGNITYTGTLTDTSDRRLKTDIESLVKYGSMLDKINAIDTYSFRMKDTPEAGKEFGVMAQELEEIFPELVHTANDEMGTKSVNYVGLIAPMIEATKELSAENAVLKAELEALRADRASVRADVDSLKEQVALLNKLAADDAEKASSLTLWLALMAVLSMTGLFGFIVVRRRKA